MRTVADQLQYIHIKKEMDMAALEVVKSMKESLRRRRTIGTSREVELIFAAPKAKKVCIAGEFNDWNATSMPMKKSVDGTWKIKLKLSPGKYEYKYVVDGTWVQDMSCSEAVLNSFSSYNSVMRVE
jgi:1,4-alpha-glucan branching enzyme